MDVGLYVKEAGSYRNVRTGETFTETEEIARMLEDGNEADDDFLRMVQSVGGFSEYSDLLQTLDDEGVRALHARFGVGYSVNFSTAVPKGERAP